VVISVCFFSDEVSPDFGESLRLGRAAGAESVELRSRLFGKRVDQLNAGELRQIRGLLAGEGLACAIIASSFGKCDLDSDEQWREHEEILRGSIAAAHALETDLVRCFPFWTPSRQDLPRPDLDANLGRIVERLGWAVEVAEREGVVLCLETEAATYSGSCAEVDAITRALGPSPAVAIAWDVNNAWLAGGEDPVAVGYPLLRDRVRHLHIKPNGDGSLATIADSVRSYGELLSLFAISGYEGAASIEHWGSSEAMLAGIRQLCRLRNDLS